MVTQHNTPHTTQHHTTPPTQRSTGSVWDAMSNVSSFCCSMSMYIHMRDTGFHARCTSTALVVCMCCHTSTMHILYNIVHSTLSSRHAWSVSSPCLSVCLQISIGMTQHLDGETHHRCATHVLLVLHVCLSLWCFLFCRVYSGTRAHRVVSDPGGQYHEDMEMTDEMVSERHDMSSCGHATGGRGKHSTHACDGNHQSAQQRLSHASPHPHMRVSHVCSPLLILCCR